MRKIVLSFFKVLYKSIMTSSDLSTKIKGVWSYKMVDFSNAKIINLAVHLIGNKSKNEELILTDASSTIIDEVTEQYIKEYFFSSFDFELSYQFFHETDVNLNELYMYSSMILQFPDSFIEQTKNIAKHLYEVSTHPNIKRGELYIAFIKNCIIDGYETNAIGIFKSESKDYYLDVIQQRDTFNVYCKKGINIKKLDKGCLILDHKEKTPRKVYIVDTSRNDALYWRNDFLRVAEIQDAYTNTTSVLNECKKFISKSSDMKKTSKISFLNSSVRYFESHENFDFDDFVKNTCESEEHYQAFKSHIQDSDLESKYEEPFVISKQAVTVAKRKIRNLIKLDSDIEIKIPPKVSAVEEIIEHGYDTQKKMKYYKIYYTDEK